PVAPVAFRRAVVEVEDDVAVVHQEMVEHELARVEGPSALDVLRVSGAVDEDHRLAAWSVVRRFVNVRRHLRTIAGGNANDRDVEPRIAREIGGRGGGDA